MSDLKDAKFTMAMTSEERIKLQEISHERLVSAATVVRVFIHQEHDRLFEEAPHRKVHGHARKRARSKP